MIRFVDVHKSFGSLSVLKGVSFDIPRGQTTAIIGPSGTGKSVLIKHVVGLLEPDSGHIWVDDVDMAHASESQKLAVRKRFGMLFQGGALFDSLTAGENVAFPLRYHTRMSEAERRAKAEEKLALVELPGLYDRPTSALSGGQRKRVGLARAIVLEPEVVLFDEPNSGLDPMTSDTIDALIGRMKQELGMTFVVITHDIVSCLNIADRIGMLYDGKLIEYGTVDQFLHSNQAIVRDFLKRNADLPPASGPLIPPP
ncbi:MAG: ABC transporter ATP-binding protein [Proteobacteria bacterium]|nr:ABC transporter ATP-binding protein [Pseudomonadota bacterium]